MKALTIRQPWATLIASGVKTIETRTRPTNIRGRIAIHAGAHRPRDYWCSSSADPEFPPTLAPLYDYGRCVEPLESNDGEWWRYRWAGPLGAVVATAELVECLPITCAPGVDRICNAPDRVELTRYTMTSAPGEPRTSRFVDITEQLPFGDFTPGRWAWLLADVQPLDKPVPAKGRLGWWEWNP